MPKEKKSPGKYKKYLFDESLSIPKSTKNDAIRFNSKITMN